MQEKKAQEYNEKMQIEYENYYEEYRDFSRMSKEQLKREYKCMKEGWWSRYRIYALRDVLIDKGYSNGSYSPYYGKYKK